VSITHRILDLQAENNGLDAPELPRALICIHRALLLAEVPGIRCTNTLHGEQRFDTAEDTPVHTFMAHITAKARKGEAIPSPREALAMFGLCCHSPIPCGAPVDCHSVTNLDPKKQSPSAPTPGSKLKANSK
jgi:hypothetical protein